MSILNIDGEVWTGVPRQILVDCDSAAQELDLAAAKKKGVPVEELPKPDRARREDMPPAKAWVRERKAAAARRGAQSSPPSATKTKKLATADKEE